MFTEKHLNALNRACSWLEKELAEAHEAGTRLASASAHKSYMEDTIRMREEIEAIKLAIAVLTKNNLVKSPPSGSMSYLMHR